MNDDVMPPEFTKNKGSKPQMLEYINANRQHKKPPQEEPKEEESEQEEEQEEEEEAIELSPIEEIIETYIKDRKYNKYVNNIYDLFEEEFLTFLDDTKTSIPGNTIERLDELFNANFNAFNALSLRK